MSEEDDKHQRERDLQLVMQSWHLLQSGGPSAIPDVVVTNFISFYNEHDKEIRDGYIRDVYAYLHAQQLKRISDENDKLYKEVEILHREVRKLVKDKEQNTVAKVALGYVVTAATVFIATFGGLTAFRFFSK